MCIIYTKFSRSTRRCIIGTVIGSMHIKVKAAQIIVFTNGMQVIKLVREVLIHMMSIVSVLRQTDNEQLLIINEVCVPEDRCTVLD
jgi:hypothetical protein